MTSIRILHTADLHYCREHKAEALASLQTIRDAVAGGGYGLVAIAGDLFDRGIQASDRDGMGELIEVVRGILGYAPIVAVRGTPTHDVLGCYEPLLHLDAQYPMRVLGPAEQWYVDDRLLVLGCPEPGKEWLLANKDGLGRDEANQAVTDAMRALLLGLGAVRREHPDIPALMVYHGSVRGATMCSGQTVPMGEIAIGREDLALVGADYYALGHIHRAQQIADMQAYYAGSAYPVDWGEREQKGYWDVTLYGGGEVGADFRPFPHPPRRKIEGQGFAQVDIEGRLVWWSMRSAEKLDTDRLLADLLALGALPGSRVTVETIPTETVRAGEITEAKALREKVRIYAEAQTGGGQIAESVLERADALEAEAREDRLVGEGLYIRIDRLRLRGAIGVWKGLGVDEVELDLRQYEEGLLALVGPNGSGKTTVIENLHPWPDMLTRGGKLQDHFRLRDSYRDLEFTDCRTGRRYRALITIDGANASGACEYYLYEEGSPLTNGRRADYERAIAERFGSLQLFLRSAFSTQKATKSNPDLSDATKGERKALFRELAGLDYLQVYAEEAKLRAQAAADTLTGLEAKAASIEEQVARGTDLERELLIVGAEIATAVELTEDLERQGSKARQEVEALEALDAENRRTLERIDGLRAQMGELAGEAERARGTQEAARKAQAGRGEAQKQITEHEALTRAREALNGKRSEILAERDQLSTQYSDALAAHRRALQVVEDEERAVSQEIYAQETAKTRGVAQVDALEERIGAPIAETCPTCGQTLPEGQRERLRAEREELIGRRDGLREQILRLDNVLNDLARKLTGVRARKLALLEPAKPKLQEFGQQVELSKVERTLAGIDIARARRTVSEAEQAAGRIAEAERRLVAIGERRVALGAEINRLAQTVDGQTAPALARARASLEDLRRRYTEAKADLARLTERKRALEGQQAIIAELRDKLVRVQAEIATVRVEHTEWEYLQTACGPDGIQALELDAMGPGIAEVANRILEGAYGSRFRVEFRTTRLAGKGSKIKQVEDFEIVVHDTEHGTQQAMDTLSGGEAVWIRRAIYDAFGIIRDRATGMRFLTAIMDEADGALDPEARLAYIRMLEAAHRESGRHQTIVITHSETAQEIIGQRVEMRELARAGKEVAA